MEEVEEKLMTPKKFSIAIEKTVSEGGGTYMDALLDYCEKYQFVTTRPASHAKRAETLLWLEQSAPNLEIRESLGLRAGMPKLPRA